MKERKKSTDQVSVEIFLGLKKVLNKDSKDYFSISSDKTVFELYDENKKAPSPDTLVVHPSYIFEQNPYENCIMYENVCRNTVNDLLGGKRQFFMTYGLSKTGKKTIIFGEENSSSNKNSRGILFRLVEDLLLKINSSAEFSKVSLTYNFYCLYQNKILDFNKLKIKDFENITETELLKYFEVVKPTKDYENEVNRSHIFTIDDFIVSVMKPLYMLYRLEPFDNKLFSRSSLIFNLQVSNERDDMNNQNVTKTNACFCTMASSESKSEVQVFNLNKTKHSINTNADMINLIQIFKNMNQADFDISKHFKNLVISSYLISVLKNNFLSKTAYKIIGCIFPAPYYHSKVKDTVMILKRLSQKSSDRMEFEQQQENQDENKEALIYNLSKKLNDSEKEIDKKRNEIEQLHEQIRFKEDKYNINLDIIKKLLGFDGDINKLLSAKDENDQDLLMARKIKECTTHNSILQNKIKELEQRIINLIKEKDKITVEKAVLENDTAMVTMYAKIKENNISDENKLKFLLEYNKEKDSLKRQNETLLKQIEALKLELNNKSNQFKQLPTILKDNIQGKENTGLIKKDLKLKYELRLKEEIENLKKMHKKEIDGIMQSNSQLVKELEEKICCFESEKINKNFSSEKKITNMQNELFLINDILGNVIRKYKKRFDLRKINIKTIPPGYFISVKEKYDIELEELILNVNKYNYPNLFDAIQQNSNYIKDHKISNVKRETYEKKILTEHLVSQNKTKTIELNNHNMMLINNNDISDSRELTKNDKNDNLNSNKLYQRDELEGMEKYQVIGILLEIQVALNKQIDKFSKLEVKLNEMTNGENVVQKHEVESNLKNLYSEIENYKKKISTQIQNINKLKIIVESQERTINNYKNEQFYKLEKDKHEVKFITPRINSAHSNFSNYTDNNVITQPINISTRVTTAKTNTVLKRNKGNNRPHTGFGLKNHDNYQLN